MATDANLLERIGRGDSEAFELLADRYREQIEMRARRMLRGRDSAGDVVQEVLLRLWTHSDQWRGTGSCGAWLLRITTNVALNHISSTSRRQENAAVHGEPEPPVHDAPDAAMERSEERAILGRLIERLPQDKQDVVRLALASENDLGSVAASLSIPKGTVKSRLHHARKMMIREWKEIASEWED